MKEAMEPGPVLSKAEGLTNPSQTPYARYNHIMAEEAEIKMPEPLKGSRTRQVPQSPLTHSSEDIENSSVREHVANVEKKLEQKPISGWKTDDLRDLYFATNRLVSKLGKGSGFAEREKAAVNVQPLNQMVMGELERRGVDLRELFLRNQVLLSKENLPKGGVGAPGPITPMGIPQIDAEVDAVNNLVMLGLSSPAEIYAKAVENISKIQDVDPDIKRHVIGQIADKVRDLRGESERLRPAEEQRYRYSLYFTPAEQTILRRNPTEWLDKQFDVLYRFAEEGQELSSPIINGVQNQVSQAVDFVKNYKPEVMSDFLQQFTVRLHLLQMRTAMGYKSMDSVKNAAHELRFHGLLTGMTLENGMVGAMFGRLQDLLEQTRLSANNRHHVMLEDAYRLQKVLIDEQMNLAKRGISGFKDSDLKEIAEKNKDLIASEKPNDPPSGKWSDFTWADRMTEPEIRGYWKGKPDGEERVDRILKVKNVNASITRTVRTAYDVFVSTQRMGVVVARGRYLLKDGSRYRSDPIGPLNVYNMEDLSFNRFDMYSVEQEQLVDKIRLDIADAYLVKAHKNLNSLTREQKLDYGKKVFRDLFAVPDQFSSGWRIEGVIQALEERYKDNANDFALFMRLKISDAENKNSKNYRYKVWEKIKTYRPEEIVRLYRERDNKRLENSLYRDLEKIDDKLKLTAAEEMANRPEGEPGGKGRELTVYDKFKQRYGAVIGLLRQGGYNDELGPRQINLTNLSKDQKEKVNTYLNEEDGAEKLSKLAKAMQDFIGVEDIGAKDPSEKSIIINDLCKNEKFSDIYTRTIIVDDALLDKLEDEKPDVNGESGYVPLSKLIGEQGAGNDTLVRSWNDTANAIEAGNSLIKFIKEESLEKRTEEALKFANSASQYNGLGSRGQAECVRYTIGSYLNLARMGMAWDIIGLKAPFRMPMSEAQRILGVQADALGRDDLRISLDHLRGYLHASVGRDREKLGQDLADLETSVKYPEGAAREERRKELMADFMKKEEASQKFYVDLERLFEVTKKDVAKRVGYRFLMYLLLWAIGESVKIGQASVKDNRN